MQLQSSASLLIPSYLLLVLLTTANASQQQEQHPQRRQASILPANLPPCATTCPALTNAQQACAPTAGDQVTYKSCFCQSAYLTTVQTSASNICSPQCSDADFGSIASWFKGFCGGSGPVAGQGTTTTAAKPTTTPSTSGTSSGASTTATAAAAPENAGDGTDADQGDSFVDPPTWFKGHWKWVVMIVVLVVTFSIIAIVGTIFHRRHKRKREYGTASATSGQQHPTHSNLGAWGPSAHSVHNFGGEPGHLTHDSGVLVGGGGIVNEKRKGKERADIARGQSKRLTKERF